MRRFKLGCSNLSFRNGATVPGQGWGFRLSTVLWKSTKERSWCKAVLGKVPASIFIFHCYRRSRRNWILKPAPPYPLRRPSLIIRRKNMAKNSAKVLLIDDHPEVLSLLSDLLTDEGNYLVHRATSVSEALNLFRKHAFQLVITDLRL